MLSSALIFYVRMIYEYFAWIVYYSYDMLLKRAMKGVHEKVINYLKHKNSTVLSSPPV